MCRSAQRGIYQCHARPVEAAANVRVAGGAELADIPHLPTPYGDPANHLAHPHPRHSPVPAAGAVAASSCEQEHSLCAAGGCGFNSQLGQSALRGKCECAASAAALPRGRRPIHPPVQPLWGRQEGRELGAMCLTSKEQEIELLCHHLVQPSLPAGA